MIAGWERFLTEATELSKGSLFETEGIFASKETGSMGRDERMMKELLSRSEGRKDNGIKPPAFGFVLFRYSVSQSLSLATLGYFTRECRW